MRNVNNLSDCSWCVSSSASPGQVTSCVCSSSISSISCSEHHEPSLSVGNFLLRCHEIMEPGLCESNHGISISSELEWDPVSELSGSGPVASAPWRWLADNACSKSLGATMLQ